MIEAFDMLKLDPKDAKPGNRVDLSENGKSNPKADEGGSSHSVLLEKDPRRWMVYDGKVALKRVERKHSIYPAEPFGTTRAGVEWKSSVDLNLDTKSSKYPTQSKNQYWISGRDISEKVITREIRRYLGPEATVRHYIGVSEATKPTSGKTK